MHARRIAWRRRRRRHAHAGRIVWWRRRRDERRRRGRRRLAREGRWQRRGRGSVSEQLIAQLIRICTVSLGVEKHVVLLLFLSHGARLGLHARRLRTVGPEQTSADFWDCFPHACFWQLGVPFVGKCNGRGETGGPLLARLQPSSMSLTSCPAASLPACGPRKGCFRRRNEARGRMASKYGENVEK